MLCCLGGMWVGVFFTVNTKILDKGCLLDGLQDPEIYKSPRGLQFPRTEQITTTCFLFGLLRPQLLRPPTFG